MILMVEKRPITGLHLIGVRWIVTSKANWGKDSTQLTHRDLEAEMDIFALSLRGEIS